MRIFRIAHTIILDDPFEDPPRLPIPSRSPSPQLDLVQVCLFIKKPRKSKKNLFMSKEMIYLKLLTIGRIFSEREHIPERLDGAKQ